MPALLYSERTGRAPSQELVARRAQLAQAVAAGMFRVEAALEERHHGSVRALHFKPTSASRATVVHFHGGGFRQGCPEMIAPFAAALARRCHVDVVCPSYRLAPEHPFPAALNDGWQVVRAQTRVGPLLLSGDSAGGGLATSLAIEAVSRGMRIAGLCLLSPWLDLTVSNESYATHARTDTLFSHASATEAADIYLQGVSARDPRASPIFAPATTFPPTFISVGSGEVLSGDSQRMHAILSEAGIESMLSVVPQMEHVAVTRNFSLVGASETFESLTRFIDARLNAPPNEQ
jgi:epsilon-lactone hydrolase